MANVTVYLPDEVEKKARRAARKARLSLSKWVSRQVSEAVEAAPREWPPEFLAALGSCPDFPEIGEIRAGYGPDAPREDPAR
jgi:hypothetical protein